MTCLGAAEYQPHSSTIRNINAHFHFALRFVSRVTKTPVRVAADAGSGKAILVVDGRQFDREMTFELNQKRRYPRDPSTDAIPSRVISFSSFVTACPG